LRIGCVGKQRKGGVPRPNTTFAALTNRIHLTDDDTVILFEGAESISFATFQALINSNHCD
jgi:hypothetical protein